MCFTDGECPVLQHNIRIYFLLHDHNSHTDGIPVHLNQMSPCFKIKYIQECILYLANEFPFPVHAEVTPTFFTSYPHPTAKRICLHEEASCQRKREWCILTSFTVILFVSCFHFLYFSFLQVESLSKPLEMTSNAEWLNKCYHWTLKSCIGSRICISNWMTVLQLIIVTEHYNSLVYWGCRDKGLVLISC